jgi:hypothetical protein
MPDIIVGPGAGMAPEIKVFDGRTAALLFDFYAFAPSFTGGVFVAGGDVSRHGFADIVVGADAGGLPEVRAFSGIDGTLVRDFFAYDPAFRGGVRVAVGDVDGDGFPDIITGTGPGAPPEVRVFSGISGLMLQDYYAFSPAFLGGIFVAAGDIDGDGRADVIVGPGLGGGSEVRVFSDGNAALLRDFFAYPPSTALVPVFGNFIPAGGLHVGFTTINGHAAILTGPGPGQAPEVKVFDALAVTLLDDFFAYNPVFLGGVFVGG